MPLPAVPPVHLRPLLAILAVAALTGCTLDGAPAGLALAPQPQPQIAPAEQIYLSAMDGPHAIAAVPLEKLPETFRRQVVAYETTEAPGTIIIHPGQKLLYFVTGPKTAIRYGISVGRAGFEWAGEAVVTQTKPWPTWTPPPEMIERDPKLAKWEKGQPGGPTNPLGARAIYLTTNGRDYGYRIHGTPDWWSIGRNASSGCIRMINQDVLDLSQRVQPGAKVIVLKADGTRATKLIVPPPAPPKKPKLVAAAAPVAADPAILPVAAPVVAPVADPAASVPAASPAVSAVTAPAAPAADLPAAGPAVTAPAAVPTAAPVLTLPTAPVLPAPSLPPVAGTTAPAAP